MVAQLVHLQGHAVVEYLYTPQSTRLLARLRVLRFSTVPATNDSGQEAVWTVHHDLKGTSAYDQPQARSHARR